jgi:hypothetical protein
VALARKRTTIGVASARDGKVNKKKFEEAGQLFLFVLEMWEQALEAGHPYRQRAAENYAVHLGWREACFGEQKVVHSTSSACY